MSEKKKKELIVDFDYDSNTITGLKKSLTSGIRTESLHSLAKNRGIRLRIIRQLLNQNLQEFSDTVGIENGSMGRIERGNTCLSILKAKNICDSLMKYNVLLNPIWLLAGRGIAIKNLKHSSIDIKKTILDTLFKGAELPEYILNFTAIGFVYNQIYKQYDPLTIFVTDSNMNELYQKGDMVGGLLLDEKLYNTSLKGQPCIIALKNKQKIIRFTHFNQNTQQIILTDTNRESIPSILSINDIEAIYIINFQQKTIVQRKDLISTEEGVADKLQIDELSFDFASYDNDNNDITYITNNDDDSVDIEEE